MTKGKCKECSKELVSDEEDVCSQCELISNSEEVTATENVECGRCKLIVNEDTEGLFCEVCDRWFHNFCCDSPLNKQLYGLMNGAPENVKWFCDKCIWETEKWIKDLDKDNSGAERDIETEKNTDNVDKLETQKRKRGRPKNSEVNPKRKVHLAIKQEQKGDESESSENIVVDDTPPEEIRPRISAKLRTKAKDVKPEDQNEFEDELWDIDNDLVESGEDQSDSDAWEPDDGNKNKNQTTQKDIKVSKRKYTKSKKSKLLGCDICNKGFHREEDLDVHKLWHAGVKKPYKCPECGKDFATKSYFEVHVTTHTSERPYMCEICGKGFMMQSVLNRHLQTHTDDKPFECPECDFKCNQKSNLNNHMLTHSSEKPFKCTQCDYTCKKATLLQHHMVTHSDEKPFACERCDKRFKWTEQLKLHVMTHTGEKPYQCTECPLKFATKDRLKYHTMGIHNDDRPFPCDECDYRAVTKSILDRHMIKHTGAKPFICDICGKQLRDGVSLKNHKLIHTGERPLKCNECGKTFRQSVTLRVHMFSHTKEKNHFCTQCGYGAPTRDKIKKHIRTVHSSETPYECDVCGNRYKEKGNLTKHKNGIRGSCQGAKTGNQTGQQKRFSNLLLAQQKSESQVISQGQAVLTISSGISRGERGGGAAISQVQAAVPTITTLPSSQTFHGSPPAAPQLVLYTDLPGSVEENKPLLSSQTMHHHHSPTVTPLSAPLPISQVFGRHIAGHITSQMPQLDPQDNQLQHYHRFAELL
ncbi:unnamed protein product [Meganyctiphanes norvegica]|uniref:Uncharacterized protein n=1 Tax=Meganyctiphanes norvegica TaxID=48144 RepID=A0AAV2SRC0_MEGNR